MEKVIVVFSKKKLLKEINKGLLCLGYIETPVKTGTFESLHYKQAKNLVLTLALELSKNYNDRFTASFYLAPSFELPYYRYGPIFEIAYQRIGRFMTSDERSLLLKPEFYRPNVIDAWWVGFNQESVSCFLKAVELSEPRFIAQQSLFEVVDSSTDAREWTDMLKEVFELVNTLYVAPSTLCHQPKRYSNCVPTSYYWAAELVLAKKLGDNKISCHGVQRVAIDAWRVKTILDGQFCGEA